MTKVNSGVWNALYMWFPFKRLMELAKPSWINFSHLYVFTFVLSIFLKFWPSEVQRTYIIKDVLIKKKECIPIHCRCSEGICGYLTVQVLGKQSWFTLDFLGEQIWYWIRFNQKWVRGEYNHALDIGTDRGWYCIYSPCFVIRFFYGDQTTILYNK